MSEQPPTDPNQPVPYAPPGYPPAPPGYPPAYQQPPTAPPYGQPTYGQPQCGQPIYGQYGPPPQTQGRTNGMAIASLVLGILWIYWIGSVLALIFGYVARNQIKQRGESGDGMAIAGIVLGWIGVGILVLGLVVGVAFSSGLNN